MAGIGTRLSLGILLLMSLASAADQDHLDARRLSEAGSILPFDTIVSRLLTEREGRVLEAALQQLSGSYVYDIEILDANGVVWEIEVDAVTGRKLREMREE